MIKPADIIKSTSLVLGLSLITACAAGSGAEGGEDSPYPDEITLDYAYYSPTSLVLKEFGWLEEAFEEEGTDIEFVLSQGSNRALEFLSGGSVDFGSTAGAAALMAKGNNAPIKNVYIYSQPEWTALAANESSGINEVTDLKGKQVAATLGTDPYIFLIRALQEHGLSANDLEIVNLQHSDGANALGTGQVDAWAGLDPHMARQELETEAELFYRNTSFNTYGFLNVREAFADEYPEAVEKVIEVYEKARKWVIENPEETAEIMAREAQMDDSVAALQLERNDFSNSLPGDEHIDSLTEAGLVLQDAGVMEEELDIEQLVSDLIDPSYAENVIDTDE
ncbi:aliphatic sulfonate ABC transporter substrate-binding protein [Alteribacter natronophilus]|uniref:aliphatic sulfonate ABC transporter substrate-binding protein n=1 Tax=Alteribacter natronophilus TaxID=2583810 RepID=UPI00110DE743|nr:aliphatic sulfonate ABC transporter substrate-binding protein [Alteribacter natronophilus]TMW71818.1 aliphatic sulfonate ABC transporter substrate-binding protein [Alteribacter natronophilus]